MNKLELRPEEIKKDCKDYSMFTWVPQNCVVDPPVMTDAEGCYYYDENGNKIFSLSSNQVFVNVGYKNEYVIGSIKKQLETLPISCSKFATEIRGKVAKKILTEFAPDNMGKVLFTLGGADSNEYAIRIAKAFTGRRTIFSQYDSYHGSTYGSSNLTGEAGRSSLEPYIPGFIHFIGPNWQNTGIDFKDEEEKTAFLLNMLRYQLEMEDPETVAAIFMETITGSNGAYVPTNSFYKGLREICDEHGILLVCDEVMMGFCRTGEYFACQNYDFKPDIITFAKGCTSGYVPMGGVLISKEIAEFFDEAPFPCGLTYNSHPMALAACLANLEFYQKENILDNVKKMGALLREGLEGLKEKHACIKEVRGKGLMLVLQLHDDYCNEECQDAWMESLYEKKYHTFGGYGMALCAPPLIVNEEQIAGIIKAMDESLAQFDKA